MLEMGFLCAGTRLVGRFESEERVVGKGADDRVEEFHMMLAVMFSLSFWLYERNSRA